MQIGFSATNVIHARTIKMGNGALYMADEEKKKNKCYLCGVDISKQSYFLSVNKKRLSEYNVLVEVCPECHHFYVYGTEEQKQKYKERRNIR